MHRWWLWWWALLLVGFPSGSGHAVQMGEVLWYFQQLEIVSGEVYRGNVLVLGGTLVMYPNARVEGNIYVLQGRADIGGVVEGDLVVMGGQVVLQGSAQVWGALRYLGGQMERDAQAQVAREVQPPGRERDASTSLQLRRLVDWVWRLMWSVLRGLALGLIAMVLVSRWPRPLERMEAELQQHFGRSLMVGALSAGVLVVVGVLLAFTVLGLPLALVVALVYYALQYLGRIVLAMPVARYLAAHLLWDWPYPAWLTAAIVVVNVVLELVLVLPCIGWVVHWVLLAGGMGAALLVLGSRSLGTNRPEMAIEQERN